MNLSEILEKEILSRVEKPSRYLGSEVNSIHKDPSEIEVRIALAFPDLYDIGLGNLGLHILYACINQLDYAWCERVYAPGLDLEKELRDRGLPLFALESKDSLDCMDLLGFTLQTELTFTNILNILQLSGIPLRSKDRTEEHPIICAGGPSVFNPEPLAVFIDFFVIGDGEDAIVEITQLLRTLKAAGADRQERLAAIAKLEGIYVPALYPMETTENGSILPAVHGPKIRKRITESLNGATFPVDYIVPFTPQVHDRVSLEVLRGCTQGCRFCQAGMTTRPVRERSLENVGDLMTRTLEKTGYEEVSLVSLSTCDHSRVRKLVENTVELAKPLRVSVSLPSLRLDSFSVELADMVAETRRTGLTVAPEAASPRLRSVINKWIPDEDLIQMTTAAFERGWKHVKMYFMLGLPTERDDDILAIADLTKRAVRAGRPHNPNAKANLGVSTFVPKPFTPFQWAPQISLEETKRRQEVLYQALGRDHSIKFGRHDPQETFLEGLISRSDRRVADLIELAFHKGCRFDAWREHLRFDLWEQAVEELGFDVEFALRERSVDERLPWDHIDILVSKQWFKEDWERAKRLEYAQDCRHSKCHKCGVIDHERALCASMLRKSIKGRKPESKWERKPEASDEEPPVVQRLWLKIGRTGQARYLSHLEAMKAWVRTLRRAKAPLSYSQGFHPHPRMSFSAALPQNVESVGEYLDARLYAHVNAEEFVAKLQQVVPPGFHVYGGWEVGLRAASLMSYNLGGDYTLVLSDRTKEEVAEKMAFLLQSDTIEVLRRRKIKARRNRRKHFVMDTIDIRPMLVSMSMREGEGVAVDLRVQTVNNKPGKAREIAALFTDDPASVRLFKRDTLTLTKEGLVSLSQVVEKLRTKAALPVKPEVTDV